MKKMSITKLQEQIFDDINNGVTSFLITETFNSKEIKYVTFGLDLVVEDGVAYFTDVFETILSNERHIGAIVLSLIKSIELVNCNSYLITLKCDTEATILINPIY